MFRPATRVLARAPVATRAPASVRLISSGPAKSRSWKNYILRLGLAGGAVYYYNTSSVFAEQPSFSALSYLKKDDTPEETRTLESITPKIREERAKAQQLENEAGQEAAFNPETGEINWDCPCLGGMAHGPCGEEFKAAFSCFVYSEEEPKGIDCIEKFKGMQDCFRLHPEVYGAELEDDEPEGGAPAPTDAPATDAPATDAPAPTDAPVPIEAPAATVDASNVNVEQSTATEGEVLVPKPAHEAEEKNQEVEKAEK